MDKNDLPSIGSTASAASEMRRDAQKKPQNAKRCKDRPNGEETRSRESLVPAGAPTLGPMHLQPAGSAHNTIAFDYIERLQQLSDPKQIQQAFMGAIGALGITNFALLEVTSYPEAFRRSVIDDCMPEGWKQRYFEQEYSKIDPCVSEAMTNLEPFLWSATLAKSRGGKRVRQIFHEAAEFQLKEGVCIPIYGPNRYLAFATLAGRDIDLAPRSRAALHMMSLYTHNRLLKLLRGSDPPRAELSRREIDCLQWVSQGKSDWEIGEILKISESTAHWYVESAKQKLGVATRIQAVMRAVSAGLIAY